MPRIAVIQKPARLSRAIDALRAKGDTIALVPTMGALHAGHLALVRQARRRARRVIVSIFVNPTQFAPHEDLASYPRTMASDVAALTSLGVDVVWAPSAEVMYPRGFATRIVPEGPARVGLEDAFRPHFFSGVATVVAKLFLQCRPDISVFGEKDYQQLKVVTAMARDLDIPVRVIGVPTVREKDGLAMSSRNAYLDAREREIAPALHRALRACADEIMQGRAVASALSRARKSVEAAGFLLDYLEARNAETLLPLGAEQNEPIRLLVAARLGKTRLIDNIPVRALSPRPRARSR